MRATRGAGHGATGQYVCLPAEQNNITMCSTVMLMSPGISTHGDTTLVSFSGAFHASHVAIPTPTPSTARSEAGRVFLISKACQMFE